jgi:hypothetical protein
VQDCEQRRCDNHFKVLNGVHEEDSPEALLAWDESQTAKALDAKCSSPLSFGHDLDLRLRESDLELQRAHLEDFQGNVEMEHGWQQSDGDRQPSAQGFDGFWRPQRLY